MSPLRSGDLFASRFEIDRATGSGGMGTVYRARDQLSGDFVALKLLHSPGTEGSESERFAREGQILAELRHPGIVAHIAHGQTPQGQRFLVMKWLDGEDLAQRLARGPLGLADALLLTQRVAEALSFAHRHGIIHRDRRDKHKIWLLGGIRPCIDGEQTMRAHPSHTAPTSSYNAERSTVTTMRRVQVALYVRVSTDKQAEFGMSVDAQTAELEGTAVVSSWGAVMRGWKTAFCPATSSMPGPVHYCGRHPLRVIGRGRAATV